MMRATSTLLAEWLGPRPVRFTYAIDGRQRRGWRSGRAWEHSKAIQHVQSHYAAAEEADVRLFAGDTDSVSLPSTLLETGDYGLFLFALPALPTLDVVQFTLTGTHNAPSRSWKQTVEKMAQADPKIRALLEQTGLPACPDPRANYERPWEAVRDALEQVWEICPFAVLFADSAGLMARLSHEITESAAARIEEMVLAISPEVFDMLEPATVKEELLLRRTLRLWWD